MAVGNGERVRGEVRKDRHAGSMRLPNAEDLEAMYWSRHREWFTFDDEGEAVFKEGTPQRVLDSYKLFCQR